MIFASFFLISLFFRFLFSFQQMLTTILKKVTPGLTHGFWPHAFSSWSHTLTINLNSKYICIIFFNLSHRHTLLSPERTALAAPPSPCRTHAQCVGVRLHISRVLCSQASMSSTAAAEVARHGGHCPTPTTHRPAPPLPISRLLSRLMLSTFNTNLNRLLHKQCTRLLSLSLTSTLSGRVCHSTEPVLAGCGSLQRLLAVGTRDVVCCWDRVCLACL
jgi:hypothetical protein